MHKYLHDGALFHTPAIPCRPIDESLTIWQLMFSFKGRINRSTFWVYTLAVFLCMWALYGNILTIPIFLPFFLCIPAWIRRLHDQNKTGQWLLCIGLPIGFYYISWFEGSKVFVLASVLFVMLGYLVILIICGFLNGTIGVNEYDSYDSLKVKILSMTIQSFLIFVAVMLLSSPLGSIFMRILHFLWTPPTSI